MTRKERFITIFAVATLTTFFSSTAMAHSAHDHSTVSYKWALSKNLKEKIGNRLHSADPTSVIGLNHFQQKQLGHYGINVGNKFNTEVNKINLLIKRTSAGMKIVDATRVNRVAYSGQVPIVKSKIFSKIGNYKNSHVGHDHSHFPYKWTFSLETQEKISKSMKRNEGNILIGLSKFEQSILNRYEIKYGNTFHTTVKDHQLMIEKVSSGIKIINHKQLHNVAMAPYKNENL
tara:strand:+ start:292 stop:987 length:696 start_codon:yes stop_codon:yes gene_type:complete